MAGAAGTPCTANAQYLRYGHDAVHHWTCRGARTFCYRPPDDNGEYLSSDTLRSDHASRDVRVQMVDSTFSWSFSQGRSARPLGPSSGGGWPIMRRAEIETLGRQPWALAHTLSGRCRPYWSLARPTSQLGDSGCPSHSKSSPSHIHSNRLFRYKFVQVCDAHEHRCDGLERHTRGYWPLVGTRIRRYRPVSGDSGHGRYCGYSSSLYIPRRDIPLRRPQCLKTI